MEDRCIYLRNDGSCAVVPAKGITVNGHIVLDYDNDNKAHCPCVDYEPYNDNDDQDCIETWGRHLNDPG